MIANTQAAYLLTIENFSTSLNVLRTDASPKNTKHIIRLKLSKNNKKL